MQLLPVSPESLSEPVGTPRRETSSVSGSTVIKVIAADLVAGDARLANLVVPPPIGAEQASLVPVKLWGLLESPQNGKAVVVTRVAEQGELFQGQPATGEIGLGEWLRQLSGMLPRDLSWPEPRQSLLPRALISSPNDTAMNVLPGSAAKSPEPIEPYQTADALVRDLFTSLRESLGQSGLFAARNLMETLLASSPIFGNSRAIDHFALGVAFKGEPIGDRSVNESPAQHVKPQHENAVLGKEEKSAGPPDLRDTGSSGVMTRISQAKIEAWFKSLASDSVDARNSAQLLLHGNLVWEGQLAPGIPLVIRRYDVWREAGGKPKRLEKGAAISVSVMLETLGGLTIEGRRWGDASEISISTENGDYPLNEWRGWGDLVERLRHNFGINLRIKTMQEGGHGHV